MPIRALILDADGVLVRPERIWAQQLEHAYGLETAEFARFIFHGDFQKCLVGQADLKAVLLPLLERLNWTHGPERFVREWLEAEHHVDAALLEHIAHLRAKGLRCCLATNQEAYRTAYLEREMGLGALLDGVFSSSRIGCRKPSPEFYHAVAGALELEGADILFWDDTLKNVEAARAAGWNAEHYTTLEGFEAQMGRWGLLPRATPFP